MSDIRRRYGHGWTLKDVGPAEQQFGQVKVHFMQQRVTCEKVLGEAWPLGLLLSKTNEIWVT